MPDVFNRACSNRALMSGSRCGGYWVWPDRSTARCTAVLPATGSRYRGSLAGIREAVRQSHHRTGNWLPILRLAVSWFSWIIMNSIEKPANENEMKGLNDVS